ncbi:MAG: alkaline phosphatase family protein [Pseudomonadota bacterium]
MTNNLNKIKHIVVLMLENRGFDNMAGWIYADQQNKIDPGKVIPPGSEPTYNGLLNQNNQGYDNTKWCPENNQAGAKKLYAQYGTTKSTFHSQYRLPAMDPHEEFNHMTYQVFGPQSYDPHCDSPLPDPVTEQPPYGTPATMQGFAIDYATTIGEKHNAAEIMECYSPDQANITAQLAKAYAISDDYYASCPTQTYPNRAFMAAGTSGGRVNNPDFHHEPTDPTIFNVLLDAQLESNSDDEDYSWCIYHSDFSLTKEHTGLLYNLPKDYHGSAFQSINSFYDACDPDKPGKLPAYSFLEPHYLPVLFDIKGANSNHPPGFISSGEKLVYDVYNALSGSEFWQDTLLIINYDEHGGCYDHQPPPWGATPPDSASDPSTYPDAQGFRFDRFGVRVPMMMISPWVDTGVVFRSQAEKPVLDHTSILATILDWKSIDRSKLPSKRVQAACSLAHVITGDGSTPNVTLQPPAGDDDPVVAEPDAPLTSLQRGIVYSLAISFQGSDYAEQSYQDVRTLKQFNDFYQKISSSDGTS